MSTTLEEALRESTADLTLDRPLDDVVARGDRLRRQRSRRIAVSGVAAAVVGATALSVTLPHDSSPLLPDANAAWGPALVNLSGDDLAEAGKECRAALSHSAWRIPADAEPIAADLRNGTAVLLYQAGDTVGACTLTPGNPGFAPRSGSTALWRELPAGIHVELISLSFGSTGLDGPLNHTAGSLRVSDAVDRLVIAVGGESSEARVGNGVAMFWVPDGVSQDELDELAITAYDADGAVLVRGPLDKLPSKGIPEPNDDRLR